nr:DUF4178 domain-containing protein [Novosphingobium aerophilum]
MNCPSCGAEVPVRGAALPYATCPYCQTLILHDARGVEEVGKVAVLPFDVSPIQLGTVLRPGDQRLTVVGRVRWAWSGGSWNEWLAQADDGTPCWLGEAAGLYMLTVEAQQWLDLPELRDFVAGGPITPGLAVQLGARRLVASDIKEVECLGSEGDLPLPTQVGTRMASIDFRGTEGEVLSLQRDGRGASAWFGASWDLAGLRATNLRAIAGWTLPKDLQ